MEWHHIVDPEDKLLDELAVRYKLHQLHIEDCRHRNQSAKIEFLEDYLFVVLKPVKMDEECIIEATDLDMFVGKDYLITVQEGVCSPLDGILERLRPAASRLSTGEMFYKVFDGIVDMYLPVTDRIGERIDELEELALNSPKTSTMEELFTLRRVLIELRRILANSRDVAGHILRTEYPQIGPELQPFFRDVYDHTAR
ncbi:MAG: magnesium transporter CorA family protein, partial [Bryobacteraceae bacterium]|nr:magnesium transporter CorA family protein [Bryobacteraceae bacterium]